jgi:hypothetical protein
MKPFLLVLFIAAFALTFTACKKKTCPAYNENQEEVYKIKGKKHKKARLY